MKSKLKAARIKGMILNDISEFGLSALLRPASARMAVAAPKVAIPVRSLNLPMDQFKAETMLLEIRKMPTNPNSGFSDAPEESSPALVRESPNVSVSPL
jgi:hypothetical protein